MKKLLNKKAFAVLAMALVLTFALAATAMAADTKTDAKTEPTTQTIKVKDFDAEKDVKITNVTAVEKSTGTDKMKQYTVKAQGPVTVTFDFEIYSTLISSTEAGKTVGLKQEGVAEVKDTTYVGKAVPSKEKVKGTEDNPALYEKGYALEITEPGTYNISAHTKAAVANDFGFVLEVVKADAQPAAPVTPATPIEKKAQSMANFTKDNDYATAKFTDVKADDWFAKDVQAAYEIGIINGKGAGLFDPKGNLTLAEAITMAVKVNNIYNNTTFTAGGEKWFDNAVIYAIKNGIITKDAYTDCNKNATRADLAAIFAKALPAAELAKINEATKVTDVDEKTPNYESIMALYQAGVLTGNTDGTFAPAADITRAEAAAIINRVAIPANRVAAVK